MKKIIFIFSILMLAATLFSCTGSTGDKIDRILEHVDVIYAVGDDLNSVTNHVTLPRTTDLNQSASLTWSSDKPLIIDNFGTFNKPDETTEVSLTLTVTLDGESKDKVIKVTVIGIYHYYTVTFEANEETYDSVKVKAGETLEAISNPEIDGFGFRGWYTPEDSENQFDFDTPIHHDMTLVAKLVVLVLADYEVKYYYQNLNDDAYVLTSTVVLSGEVGIEVDASEAVAGYTVDTELSVAKGIVTNDNLLALKVYYERNSYEVTFISDQVEISSTQYKFGETVSAITEPEKDGYSFEGWSSVINETTPHVFPSTVSDNLTFYAIWRFDDGISYEGYYEGADGLIGANLKTFLRTTVNRGKTLVDYGAARYILDDSDKDPINASRVILVYKGTSVSGVWDFGSTWNREHVWPQSLLGASADNDIANVASDLQNLKPADPATNSSRGNKFFDTVTNATSYNPRSAVRGDLARILFYMDVTYANLNLVNTTPSTYQMGKLDTLLKWHLQDPVDDFERNRNEVIFGYQNNRNPFIDHPEFVEKIWGPITLTASDDEVYSIEIDFKNLVKIVSIVSYEINYVEFKKESQYLM